MLLFAAGTDAEWYEDELRKAGLPTYRATGRGYFGQQQVGDLLAYLRLLQNRYDDESLVSVLASPLVGVSNDALVLLRRAAPKRPLFVGLEKGLPDGVAPRDEQLFRAFLQRYHRIASQAPTLTLERLCEQIVAEHDYDLAVLAQWDGKRRYANLRKLARLARSYEELRGPDIEGFVRFVREQEAVGARELEAVAEEEGADAIRLLTIHAAKGLEFKVVVVADAGRDRIVSSAGRDPRAARRPVRLPRRRSGERPPPRRTGIRRGARGEHARGGGRATPPVLRGDDAGDRPADRRRLGEHREAGDEDADRLGTRPARCRRGARAAAGDPVEIEREQARLILRLDRGRVEPEADAGAEPAVLVAADGQLALFADDAPGLPPPAPALARPRAGARSRRCTRPRRLSFSALALFERCSYRYFAERVVGMAPADASGRVPGQTGMAATEVGDAVHTLLELIDLQAPATPPLDEVEAHVRAKYPAATGEELERIRGFVASYCESELAARVAGLEGAQPERPFAFEHGGVLLHGRLDVLHRTDGRALVLDYKTNTLAEGTPEEIVDQDYRLQRLVYALACFRGGAEEVEVVYHFLERPDAVVATVFRREEVPVLEAELSAAIARIQAGEFRPTPSEFVCAGCPALDVVCAGPRLLGL